MVNSSSITLISKLHNSSNVSPIFNCKKFTSGGQTDESEGGLDALASPPLLGLLMCLEALAVETEVPTGFCLCNYVFMTMLPIGISSCLVY